MTAIAAVAAVGLLGYLYFASDNADAKKAVNPNYFRGPGVNTKVSTATRIGQIVTRTPDGRYYVSSFMGADGSQSVPPKPFTPIMDTLPIAIPDTNSVESTFAVFTPDAFRDFLAKGARISDDYKRNILMEGMAGSFVRARNNVPIYQLQAAFEALKIDGFRAAARSSLAVRAVAVAGAALVAAPAALYTGGKLAYNKTVQYQANQREKKTQAMEKLNASTQARASDRSNLFSASIALDAGGGVSSNSTTTTTQAPTGAMGSSSSAQASTTITADNIFRIYKQNCQCTSACTSDNLRAFNTNEDVDGAGGCEINFTSTELNNMCPLFIPWDQNQTYLFAEEVPVSTSNGKKYRPCIPDVENVVGSGGAYTPWIKYDKYQGYILMPRDAPDGTTGKEINWAQELDVNNDINAPILNGWLYPLYSSTLPEL